MLQTGLGTAAASRVVTVKSRVDGLLQNVLFTEGQQVKAGEVLAEIDPKPFQVALAQAEGQLARDQAQLANARQDLERYKTLLAQDSIARQQLDQQEATVRQLEGTVKIDQAVVENARLQLSYTRVTAPISGRLGLRQIDPGNMVRSSDSNGLVVITQLDPIAVVFTVPQDVLPRILKRLKTGERIAVDVLDREQKSRLASGTLLTADNQIDVATGTVKMKALFANPEGTLYPNQFVNVSLVVETRKSTVIIPAAAVQRGAQGTLVYVVKDDKTVNARPVKLGPVEGDNVGIESGVMANEQVVIDGVDRLREGAKVEVTVPFVPRPRSGDPSKRGPGARSPGGPPGAVPATSAPAPASPPPPTSPATGAAASGAVDLKALPPWSQMSDAQKAAVRARMSTLSEEEKAAFRSSLRERPGAPAADASAPTPSASPAAAPPPAAAPASGELPVGRWNTLSEEQKAVIREKMSKMSDEERAAFRQRLRERAGQ